MTDFALKLEGHRESEMNEWRRFRFLGGLIVNTAGKYVKKKVKETDLIRLPGEEVKRKKGGDDLADQIKQLQTYQNQKYKKV